ncbi:hypothetical protein [Pseudarthrobacter sp. DSP2-3-2b1]|uniref:hypothetical protein n=1 Tax=Pseudarthrobacter sp. DSP2-3-2b1 TaxID=2804661 RepID=UPI003CF6C274
MMNLTDGGGRPRRRPKREILEDVGLTTLSVTAALILLPAIGARVLVRSIFPVKADPRDADRTSYLIQ